MLDLDGLRRAAAALEAAADDVRAARLRLLAGAAAVRWHSPAADAHRERLSGLARSAVAAAEGLDEAAAALRLHARAAEDRAAELERRARALAAQLLP